MAHRNFSKDAALLLVVGSSLSAACIRHGDPDAPPIEEPVDELIMQASPPPPIDGGTLIVTRASDRAVAADPDRDRIWVIDTAYQTNAAPSLLAEIALEPGDLPGRLVEDGAGLVHVVLRGAGAIATVDIASGEVKERRPVCAAPRGIDSDDAAGTLLVACEGGELVTLPAAGGPATRTIHVDSDLRDVVADGDRVLVSRFRAAEILVIDEDGAVTARLSPDAGPVRKPTVAWRMAPRPGGGAVMVYQMALKIAVNTDHPDAYSDGASGDGPIVIPGTAVVSPPSAGAPKIISVDGPDRAALPVDIAVSPDQSRFALPSAGSGSVWQFAGLGAPAPPQRSACGVEGTIDGCQPVAVAYDAAGRLIVQSREPASIMGVLLPVESRRDTGHDLFHLSPNEIIACASCHPVGLEDGHVWRVEGDQPRRTPTLAGRISGTAPFHWKGDLADMGHLMSLVFVDRMGGEAQDEAHVKALSRWIDTIPALPVHSPADEAAVARGEALFESAEVGCASCHSGAQLTNNQTVDVGTGGLFQVPRLVGLASRAPYMHDGCAQTLFDRFGPCGGGDKHGHTSQLTDAEIADLVAYLTTL